MAILRATTKYGVVRGVEGITPSHSVFKGIPFAKPPIGILRFAPPKEPDSWDGELVCDKYSDSAIQRMPFVDKDIVSTSEDCLYLNIWTPAESTDEKLPVMFWVHGGGFMTGCGTSPEFGGEALNSHGVIVVTINYRINALGYIALPELQERDGTTGNAGLLDQMAALKWVYENIGAFGGDPENITIFGFSGGGMSCRMLYSSPVSWKYVSKVIVESGGGVTDSDYYRPLDVKIPMIQAGMKKLGWTFEDLLTMDPDKLCDGLQDATEEYLEGWEKTVFCPSVDGIYLQDTPGVSIWKGDCPDIPVMVGAVSGDYGWLRIVEKDIPDPDMIPACKYSRGVSWAARNLELGRKPLYTYYFERTQPEIRWPNPKNRTPHGSEVTYVFGTMAFKGYKPYDYELSRMLSAYWANFAKTGNPNGKGLEPWPLYTETEPVSMHITDTYAKAEELASNSGAKRMIKFVTDHPGVIRNLNGL